MEQLYTSEQVQEILDISRTTLWRRIKEGEFPRAIKLLNSVNSPLRIPRGDLEHYIKAHGVSCDLGPVKGESFLEKIMSGGDDGYLTMDQVQEYLQIGRSTLWRYVYLGYFQNHIKVNGFGGGPLRLSKSDLRMFLEGTQIDAQERSEITVYTTK